MKAGLLDFADLSIPETLDLAREAELAGFGRFWLAEHHGEAASYADTLLMTALVAGSTDTLRVGPAGVLLRYYAPLAVCNSATQLAHTFPDRIDLGLAGGAAEPRAAHALADGRDDLEHLATFDRKVRAVMEILHGRSIPTTPRPLCLPSTWLLGSGGARAMLAAEQGLAYCLSLFHRAQLPEPSLLAAYRDAFRATSGIAFPMASIAVATVISDDGDRARAAARDLSHGPIRRCLGGTAAEVVDQLRSVAHAYAVEEIVVLECSRGFAARRTAVAQLGEALRR